MNPPHSLVLGEVRQPFDHPKQYRVIGFDQHEVHYDVFNPVIQSWSFGLSLSKSYYYRGFADRFFRESTHVRFQPLTEGEANLFRPDLPMRLCRNPSINWSFTPPGDRASFEIAMRSAGLDLAPLPDLPTPRVVLLASRLKASTRGVLCEAENGASFPPKNCCGTLIACKPNAVGTSCRESVCLGWAMNAEEFRLTSSEDITRYRSQWRKRMPIEIG